MGRFINLIQNIPLWNDVMKIYDDSFPEWERESVANILVNMLKNKYEIVVYLCENEIQGFYILDINTKLNYTLLTFLAVKKELRGKGVGSKLCLNAIDFFKNNLLCEWFLIEAEDMQTKFYKKFGLKEIDIDYSVPKFNSKESVAMDLMYITKDKKIDADSLSNIIEDIFIVGYSLEGDDERLQKQIKNVQKN